MSSKEQKKKFALDLGYIMTVVREDKNIPKSDVVDNCDVSYHSLRVFEAGNGLINLFSFYKMCRLYGLSLDDVCDVACNGGSIDGFTQTR